MALAFFAAAAIHWAWSSAREQDALQRQAVALGALLDKSPELDRTQKLLESLATVTDREGRPVEAFIVAGQEIVRACAREAEKGQEWAVVRQRMEQQWPSMALVKVPLFRDPSNPDKNTGDLYVASRIESPLAGAILFGALCGTLLGLACLVVARGGRRMIEGPTRYEAMVAETAPTAQAAVGFAEPLEREARAAEEASAGVEVAAKRAAESVEVAAEPVAGSVAEDSPAGAVEAAVEETPESVVYGAAEEAPESVAQVAEEAASPGVVEPAAPPCPTEPAVPAPPPSLEGKPPSAPSPLGPGSPVATGQDPQPPTTGRRPGGPSVDRDTREARRSSDPFRDTRVHGTQADALRAQAMRMAVDSPAPREEKPEAAPVERIEASYDHRTGGHDSPAPGSPPEVRERLRFNRFDCAITVRYELTLEGTSVRGEGTLDALNVSVGGLKIRARHKLSVGNQMTLQLPLPDGVIRAKAKVVWTRPKDNEAGIEFVSLTDEDCGRLLTALESDGFPPSPFLD